MTEIRPAGMTYDRALEIAIESRRRQMDGFVESTAQDNGHRVSPQLMAECERLVALRWTSDAIARALNVSERTAQRLRRRIEETQAWRADQKRRQNLESFRHMTVEWAS